MTPVFSHGRLRLYLLKLLDQQPKHGYELIRQLEDQFMGLYAPSAGTIYPRLQRLEADGLVTHTQEGGRKVYSITDAGRAELRHRQGELADVEAEIRDSVHGLAEEIREEVRGTTRDVKGELRRAARDLRNRQGSWWDRARHDFADFIRLASEQAPVSTENGHAPSTVEQAELRLRDFVAKVRHQLAQHSPTSAQLDEIDHALNEALAKIRAALPGDAD